MRNDPEWENDLCHITPIADQMVKARWLKGYATNENGMAYQWTELGLLKVKQLSDIYTELAPAIYDTDCTVTFWAIILRAAVVNGFRDSL